MSKKNVLEIENVVKTYGKIRALNEISISVERGVFMGILGPNGAGKTTLFQIIAGLVAPNEGNVWLFGKTHKKSGANIRSRIGVVYQDLSVDMDLPVTANLRFHGRLFGLSGNALSARIEQVSHQFGLSALMHRPVRELSGGQRRKVEIARAIMNNPDLLLLDEASAGLDPPSRLELIGIIQSMVKEKNVTVLWASHLVDEVENADTILVLSSGKIVANGCADDLIKSSGAKDLVGAFSSLTDI